MDYHLISFFCSYCYSFCLLINKFFYHFQVFLSHYEENIFFIITVQICIRTNYLSFSTNALCIIKCSEISESKFFSIRFRHPINFLTSLYVVNKLSCFLLLIQSENIWWSPEVNIDMSLCFRNVFAIGQLFKLKIRNLLLLHIGSEKRNT